jgi:C4-dicarboxylate-specific signal transduction histidine kinase
VKLSFEWSARMLAKTEPQKKSAFKNPFLYSWAVLAIVALVVVAILVSRWMENRRIEERAMQEKTQKQLEQDRIALEQFGGRELAIQNFYATPGTIRRGETVKLCYGVANAKTVKLEPQSNPVWPSYSRCVDVTPTKSTTYTLTIADAAGNTKTQSLEVKVR